MVVNISIKRGWATAPPLRCWRKPRHDIIDYLIARINRRIGVAHQRHHRPKRQLRNAGMAMGPLSIIEAHLLMAPLVGGACEAVYVGRQRAKYSSSVLSSPSSIRQCLASAFARQKLCFNFRLISMRRLMCVILFVYITRSALYRPRRMMCAA